MGRIAKILSFTRLTRNGAKVSDVKVDAGGGANVTAEHFSPAGDDSQPLTTDYSFVEPTERNGGAVVVDYLDPLNEPKAQPGDKRIYARDPDTGAAVVELWLKNDGSMIASNALGSLGLLANGNIVLNGVIIDPSGNISGVETLDVATSLTLNLKELVGHTHSQDVDSSGDTQQDTGPNL